MRKPSLSQVLYDATFPRPRPNDPTSFAAHVTRNLVPEVRIETQTFYGTLDCVEAQYPGLDYSSPVHRMRLSRFPWHRKLFKVMDELRLTRPEIDSVCRWEGTRSARENYEREERIIVRDTTAEEITADPRPVSPVAYVYSRSGEVTAMVNAAHARRSLSHAGRANHPSYSTYSSSSAPSSTSYRSRQHARRSSASPYDLHIASPSESDEDDFELESYGHELNQRLMVATEARARGADVPLDEEWEQWLKEAAERGGYGEVVNTIRSGNSFPISTSMSTRSRSRSRSSSAIATATAPATATATGTSSPSSSSRPYYAPPRLSMPSSSRTTVSNRTILPSLRRTTTSTRPVARAAR